MKVNGLSRRPRRPPIAGHRAGSARCQRSAGRGIAIGSAVSTTALAQERGYRDPLATRFCAVTLSDADVAAPARV
jgi:hypothetical protein